MSPKLSITPGIAEDLDELGIGVPSGVEVIEAEKADILVVMRHTPGDPPIRVGNLFGKCSKCDHDVQFSARSPNIKRVCNICIVELVQSGGEN